MNKTVLFAVMIGSTAILASCQTTPTTPDEFIKSCSGRVKHWDYSVKSEAAIYAGTTIEKMPGVICRRILKAVQQGRLKQEDFSGLDNRGSPIWKIIKGQ